jgi:hypothetical protein
MFAQLGKRLFAFYGTLTYFYIRCVFMFAVGYKFVRTNLSTLVARCILNEA